MKKIISVLLCLILIFCTAQTAFAGLVTDTLSVYPVIMVPGYASAQLYIEGENGSEQPLWGLDGKAIVEKIVTNLDLVAQSLGKLTSGKVDKLVKTVGDGMVELCGGLACDDSGNSVYPVKVYCNTAQECCSADLFQKYPDGKFQYETEIMAEVAEHLKNYGGYEKVFNFNCDFRMSIKENAERLDAFVQDVLRYTGSEKVNLIAVSHGGQITAAYLARYAEKKQIHNAVLNVPAIGGAGLAYDVLNGDIHLDEELLLRYIEHGMMFETDFHWLVQANQLGLLDEILNGLVPYIHQILGNWCSIWDFVPIEQYEKLKQKRLDPVKNAELIRKSDEFHYEIYPTFQTALQKCNDEYDMNVSIIAGTDHPLVSGWQENSDGIITVHSSTGAAVAPFGKRFADGYFAENGKAEYISPAMTIDASNAYLPKNTWFIQGLFHGMEYKDPYTIDLLMKLALSDDIENVYSDARFPRFHATTNKSSSVFAYFEQENGTVKSTAQSLTVRNLSEWFPMLLLSVQVDGADMDFDIPFGTILLPGKAVCLHGNGAWPKTKQTRVCVTVTYALVGSMTPLYERTLFFVTQDGEAVANDGSAAYASAYSDAVEKSVNVHVLELLQKTGLWKLYSIFYHIVMSLTKCKK